MVTGGTVEMDFDEEVREDFFDIIEPETWRLLGGVSEFLADQGIQAYVVGGFVRDVLLGRSTADIDIALAADALKIAPRVATALGGKYVLLDRENRVGRVVLVDKESPSIRRQRELDFTTFSGDIEQDLARRDFTINAMAIELNQLVKDCRDIQLIEPLNGRDDLRQGIIRSIAETAFESDAVRLLRAVRLAAELGFSIDEKTEAQIVRYSHLIARVASERVREELLRLMAISDEGQLLAYLDKLGLLTAMISELSPARGVEQPKEHHWDVFDHSLRTVTAVDFLLRQGSWEYADEKVLDVVPWSDVLAEHFTKEVSSGSIRRVLLKLAALLHDVAKPLTKAIDDSGRMRFLGHPQEGADIVVDILERLRFSGKEVKVVATMIKHHLRPTQLSQGELPSRRAIYRYFRDTGETGIDILFLSLADHLATRGPHLDLAQWREHTQMTGHVLARHFEQEEMAVPVKLVDGHDLINVFGMKPGPEMGELLAAVQEAQASGELTTRQEALTYVRECLLKESDK